MLTGLNRPSRWPELSAVEGRRGARGLPGVGRPHGRRCRGAARARRGDHERPRRSAPQCCDARGAARRRPRRRGRGRRPARASPASCAAYPELRATIGATPVAVVANRLRPGALGHRCAGSGAAHARPVRRHRATCGSCRPTRGRRMPRSWRRGRSPTVAPRSPLTLAVRRFVGEAVAPVGEPQRGTGARASPVTASVCGGRPHGEIRALASSHSTAQPAQPARQTRLASRLEGCRPSAISSTPRAGRAKPTSSGSTASPATASSWRTSPSPTS